MVADKQWAGTLGTREDQSVGPDRAFEGAARERRGPVVESELQRRWREARVVLSLAFFPGCPQAFIGQPARGVVWSLVFLLVVLPLSFFLFFAWAFSESALFWALIGLGAFLALGALGPLLQALRGSLPRTAVRSSGVVAAYAAVIVLAVAAECGWFLYHHFETVTVTSEFLEPLTRQGEVATILLSPYVRPVHGEVILFARPADLAVREDDRPHLGRVVAKPGDEVSLRSGELFVNRVRIEFDRSDQRRQLEKAGRKIRRERLLSDLFHPEADLSAVRDRRVSFEGEDWKLVLPAGGYLVVPDVRAATASPGDGSTRKEDGPRSPVRVPVAWLVDRTDVIGRMIARFW